MFNSLFKDRVYQQDYSLKQTINGVKLVDFAYFSDDGGSFCELLRMEGNRSLREYFPDFELKQVNWSVIEPGLIKAGHVHKKQADIWFVPPTDKLLVGLMDLREGSPTVGIKMRFVLGAGRARLLYVPSG